MSRPAIMPTVTHRVRGFLAQSGVDLRPWSGLDETYAALYALMRRRTEDPLFWEPLGEIVAQIIEASADADHGCLSEHQAKVLRAWEAERVVAGLREALASCGSSQPEGGLLAFTRRLPAPVLGGFLLVGLVASGCHQSTSFVGNPDALEDSPADTALDTTADTAPDPDADLPEWADGCTLDPGSVLFSTIASSELSDWDKTELCACFSELNVSWNDGLTALFATGTPDQIARALSEMMECCYYEPYALETSDFEEVRDRFLDGTLCWMALPYRGVSFPRR